MAVRKSKGSSSRKKSSRKFSFRGNVVAVMLLKLAVAWLFFVCSRVLFYLFNLSYFNNLTTGEVFRIFIDGLRFDLAGILIINTPFILAFILPVPFRKNRIYRGIANGYFYFINILGLMVNFVDTIYFRFTLKRLTADIFNYLGVGGDFNKLIPQFIHDFWYIQVLWVVISILFVWTAMRFQVADEKKKSGKEAVQHYLIQALIFLAGGFLLVTGIRGGFQLRPIGIVTAGNYTTAKNVPLILNTPFSIAKSFGKATLETKLYFKREADLEKVYTPVHKGMTTGFKPYNVIIIIMESFSREHIGILNKDLENGSYKGFTPVMDSLIRAGCYFDAFANGKTSIQGIPAVLSSIPSLMDESFIQSPYAGARYTSIAGLLKSKGYTSAFFHGGTNGTMGFDAYTRMVGFDKYFGRTQFNNEKYYDGKWGIRDEEFFRYFARSLDNMHPPFLAAFFSLSSHHPYYVPEQYRGKFRKGRLPIQESIMYADYSLGKFLNTIKAKPWFGNTIIVITADHTSEGYYPYYQTGTGQYAIPLLFLFPGNDKQGLMRETAQQTDIMPTLLDYMGYDKDYIAFGTDLLDNASPHFSIHYVSGLYGLIKDGHMLEFNGTQSTALFDLRKDPSLKRNIVTRDAAATSKVELFMKAFIQQYNNRVTENRLTLEP